MFSIKAIELMTEALIRWQLGEKGVEQLLDDAYKELNKANEPLKSVLENLFEQIGQVVQIKK